jgi:hypothetical protein
MCGVKVESKSKIYGFVASGGDVKVEGGGEIFGGVLAKKFKGEGKGKVHFDHVYANIYFRFSGKSNLIIVSRFVTLLIPESSELSVKESLQQKGIHVIGEEEFSTRNGMVKSIIVEVTKLQDIAELSNILDIKFRGNFIIDKGGGLRALVNSGIVITFKPDISDADIQRFFSDFNVAEKVNLRGKRYLVYLPVSDTYGVFNVLHSILNDPRVIAADPDFVKFVETFQAMIPTITPNDPRFPDQWNLGSINARRGWAFIYGGTIDTIPIFSVVHNVSSAVIDTGVERTHEDLQNVLTNGETTFNCPHGTRVAGIMGAHTNNNLGIAGVIWSRPNEDLVMPYETLHCSPCSGGCQVDFQDIVNATRAGAMVLNASWGGGSYTETELSDIAYPLYCGRGGSQDCDVIYDSSNNTCTISGTGGLGSPFIFAAGNTRQGQQTCSVISPGNLANTDCFRRRMLVVSSIDDNNVISSFSCTGPEVSVSAPGECVPSTTTGNTYVNCIDGTSFAAPHVTGLAGLILKLNPRLSVQDVFDIITRTAIDLGDPGRDNNYGYGRIDVERAVVWTIFRGFSASQEFLSSNSLIIQSAVGSTISAVFQVANGGESPIFATIRIHPQESGGISASLPRGTDQSILVISPGQSANISITFRKNIEGPSEGRFTLTYCRDGLALEPQAFNIFGGDLVSYPDFLTPVSFEFLGRVMPLLVRCTDFEITVRTPPVCGDGICEGNENCINCAQDCGSCPPPPGGGSECASFCKLPLCIPIFCLPKAGCIYICLPPPGWAVCPFCCLWCLFVFGDPGHGIPEEIPPELADIMQSPECNLCSESLKSEGGSAFGKPECKLCIEKVVQRGASLSYQCDMCLMNIRDYGEQGADSSWCAICKDQWEAMYEAYKDAVQSTMP